MRESSEIPAQGAPKAREAKRAYTAWLPVAFQEYSWHEKS